MPLDLLTIGRVSLDLFSEQAGEPFPNIRSFATSVGGSPVNIAIGASRLGIKSATLTAVGEDPVGDFVLHFLENEAVDTRYIIRKPHRRTGLAVVGVEPPDRFPLVFYRDAAADWQLNFDDVRNTPVAEACILLLSGTALSASPCRDACFAAAEQAIHASTSVWMDLDLRPDQWIHPLAYGVTMRLALRFLEVCIGTEEEWFAALAPNPESIMAGNSISPAESPELYQRLNQTLDDYPQLTLVVKRGAAGVQVYQKSQPVLTNPSQKVEIVNTVGAGDAFAAGLIASRLNGSSWHEAARFANACGAIVVSRPGCSTALPYPNEVQELLVQNGVSV